MLSETFILLLVCTTAVRSWQDSIKTADEHSVENTECLIEKSVEKYSNEKLAVIRKEGECSASEGATHDETDCGMLVDEEDDQSALLMLGQEDQEFSIEDNTAPEECPQHFSEKDTCESVDSSLNSPKEEHYEEFTSESNDVRADSLVVQDTHSDVTERDKGNNMHESNSDLPGTDEVTNKEPEKELEPEQENVPLREILLKLKVSTIAQ